MTAYRIRHETRYEYDLPVVQAHHHAHLRPRATPNQRIETSRLKVSPGAADQRQEFDYFGNPADQLEILTTHDELVVAVDSTVQVEPNALSESPPVDATTWEYTASLIRTDASYVTEREYCFDSPLVRHHQKLRGYAEPVFQPGRSLVDSVIELNQKINDEFDYEPAATDVSTPLAQVLRERRGVCQDFAQLAVGCLRSLGLAARYVSGYLETRPPEGQPRLVGADASHAWASVFLPGLGWLDFDPTNAMLPSERHITVAWGRDFSDVSPLKGVVLGGGRHSLTVGVDVLPLDPAPN